MRGKQFREALGARPAAMGIALLTALVFAACESAPPVAPEEGREPRLNFTNGPATPNLIVFRDPDGTYVAGGPFVHFNTAAEEPGVPGAGNVRPLFSFHHLDPLNHPFFGCGDDTSPDETVAWQRVTTPSKVGRILELSRDRASPVSVYEGTWSEFLADPCAFIASRLVAEGVAGFTGQFQWDDAGPTLLGGSWQGTLTDISGGAVRLNEVLQYRLDKKGNFRALVDNISLHDVGG